MNCGEAIAQLIDVGSSRYGKASFKLEKRCATHRRGVGLGFHRFDVDAQSAEYATDLVDDPGMVHARNRKFVREKKFRWFSRRRPLDSEGKTGFCFHLAVVAGNLDKAATVAADQDDDGKLAAKNGHLAVLNVAAVPGDKLGDLFHQADLIGPDRG